MPGIVIGTELCTVIVSVDAAREVMPALEAHALAGLERFRGYRGFVGGALHRSADGSRLIQYLQWQTEADHLACMSDPGWDEDPSATRFMEFVNSGAARLDVRTYRVIGTSNA